MYFSSSGLNGSWKRGLLDIYWISSWNLHAQIPRLICSLKGCHVESVGLLGLWINILANSMHPVPMQFKQPKCRVQLNNVEHHFRIPRCCAYEYFIIVRSHRSPALHCGHEAHATSCRGKQSRSGKEQPWSMGTSRLLHQLHLIPKTKTVSFDHVHEEHEFDGWKMLETSICQVLLKLLPSTCCTSLGGSAEI